MPESRVIYNSKKSSKVSPASLMIARNSAVNPEFQPQMVLQYPVFAATYQSECMLINLFHQTPSPSLFNRDDQNDIIATKDDQSERTKPFSVGNLHGVQQMQT